MLSRTVGTQQSLRRARQLWHDAVRNAPSLGCTTCPEKALCGGICVEAPFYDCFAYCCGKPGTCRTICRRKSDFAERVHEVEGFDLSNAPEGPLHQVPELPSAIPIIFHGSSRTGVLVTGTAALPFGATFGRRAGDARVGTPEAVRARYRLAPKTNLVLTGISEDEPIERWWGIGIEKRRGVIRAMKAAAVGMVTTPNFSLTLNAPRWDDLDAMKRIALVYSEFINEGMPTALHVNGRTDSDFARWTDFVAARSEVTHIAYEFATISNQPHRRKQHAAWLCGLAVNAGRPLHLIVRGGTELLREFALAFARVTVLETDSFMLTMKRQEAVLRSGGAIHRQSSPTLEGAPLDALLLANVLVQRAAIEYRLHLARPNGSASKV